jgi:uncharacterized protein
MKEHERGKRQRSLLSRVILLVFKIGLGVVIGFGILIYFLQDSMIYLGVPYEPGEVDENVSKFQVVRLPFESDQGRQEAYWLVRGQAIDDVPPIPDRVWLVFGGNAAQALGWGDFFALYRGSPAGFLLMDYPGYGACEGKPSPATILDSTQRAVTSLCQHLSCSEEQLRPRLAVFGQSLGAAAGLQAATYYKISRVVLISPFTRMLDMARRTAGPLHCHLLRHRWDNVARLEEMEQFAPPPHVSIIHGTEDEIVPVEMGRELGERFRKFVDFTELPGLGHNDITYSASEEILDAIALPTK